MADLPQYPHHLLPMPQQEGYAFTPVSPLLRTSMQSGRARQRRNYRSTPTEVPITWLFVSDAQAQLFEAWFQDALADGALWFEMQLKTPAGIQSYRCRFIEIYDGPALIGGRYWRFTSTLELRERPVIQGGWGLDYPEALRYMNFIDLTINREWPQSSYQVHMAVFDYSQNQEWPDA
ncbi:hypothetical protein SAMN05216588_12463 [Pseudomonas flavescens]|uniref:Uncharacterized protein n=1 Tax=Phytopseudomonas flavescens TaxID=29435 RepID=A0A1G8NC84_9GAMM|nr:hypothetical protein [Pseudomonas flavescens]SDI77745.1 hypothetical protein SAMN05216588_12463 [Pseudomonas flavescens]